MLTKITTLLLLLVSPFASSDAATIVGAGTGTCGSWLQDRQENYGAKLHWLQGFLSAYNFYVYSGRNPEGIFAGIDHNAIAAWMDNYCRENPLSSPSDGALRLIKELEQRADRE